MRTYGAAPGSASELAANVVGFGGAVVTTGAGLAAGEADGAL
jgi:hypothetical protein